jgi:hypothetical protein
MKDVNLIHFLTEQHFHIAYDQMTLFAHFSQWSKLREGRVAVASSLSSLSLEPHFTGFPGSPASGTRRFAFLASGRASIINLANRTPCP